MRSGAPGWYGWADSPGLWAHVWANMTAKYEGFSGAIDLYFADSGVYTTSGNADRWNGIPLRCLVR